MNIDPARAIAMVAIIPILKRILPVICAWTVFPMLALGLSFYWLGSLVPDPATGRTYPVHIHETMYVNPILGVLQITLFIVGAASFAGVLAIDFWERRNGRNKKTPPRP